MNEKHLDNTFPPEIWISVAYYLSVEDKILLASTSYTMAHLIYDTPTLWYDLFIRPAPDRPHGYLIPLLHNLLGSRLSEPSKLAVRDVTLEDAHVEGDSLALVLANCPRWETLSVRGSCQKESRRSAWCSSGSFIEVLESLVAATFPYIVVWPLKAWDKLQI